MVTRFAPWRGFLISSVCGILTALAIAPVTPAQAQRPSAPDQPVETVVTIRFRVLSPSLGNGLTTATPLL